MQKRIVILGAGESGTGAALLAISKGFDVFVSDSGKIRDQYRSVLEARDIKFEEGSHSVDMIMLADIIIKSPGIPGKAPVVVMAREKGIPVISEIEFAGRYTGAYKIFITGSNGKTTTANLIYYLLKESGLNVGLAGNVGKSFALQVAEDNYDNYVIELSSFQLDDMFDFRADISVLLNITPDHLDRYDYIFQNYIDSKFRIINNQGAGDRFIFWADDPVIAKEIKKRNPAVQLLPFSAEREEGMAAFIHNNELTLSIHNKTETIMTIHDLALKGR
ncbi:MAG: UDP-N-acetylmuramoyl-L-alanine--D-glutamate ligase, partial [Bacteroidia bacterium]